MKDPIGDRMTGYYEDRSKTRLVRRMPVIVRSDGKSFHNFCRRFEKPYDEFFNKAMNDVMKHLCQNVQGCKFAERHSDEISLLLTDYETLTTDAFFDYEVQKICSVVASMATAEFCKWLKVEDNEREDKYGSSKYNVLSWAEKWPNFDCRCFNIPKEEVVNYFRWRNQDCTRNSINMLARSYFSAKQLHGKSTDEVQEMLFSEHGVNWNDIDQGQKAGFYCVKERSELPVQKGPNAGQTFVRNVWNTYPCPATRSDFATIIELLI
jgi:tRNA(His) 5'-end guanylyltransferase